MSPLKILPEIRFQLIKLKACQLEKVFRRNADLGIFRAHSAGVRRAFAKRPLLSESGRRERMAYQKE